MEIILTVAFIIGAFYILSKEKKKCAKSIDYSKDSL
ncbi:hypothetical protein CZ814_01312 [Photobacterium toruni]|uniref:Uncharacterized protein n=1 Tax=Photobacterium toruni TaxID=1935446 RepID=A0A1T4RH17_9GAMM|nr:hypothetical protein CZ814_01312 [Photobacterium toruni]